MRGYFLGGVNKTWTQFGTARVGLHRPFIKIDAQKHGPRKKGMMLSLAAKSKCLLFSI